MTRSAGDTIGVVRVLPTLLGQVPQDGRRGFNVPNGSCVIARNSSSGVRVWQELPECFTSFRVSVAAEQNAWQ